ncbi:MAG: hypothetical protein IJB67_07400 [Firmicutes bacterium]|nr:hypothetical protein [Bacillota bacterium]
MVRKRKTGLLTSIFQLSVGVLAVLAYFVAKSAESGYNWTVNLILGFALIAMGIIGVIGYCRDNRRAAVAANKPAAKPANRRNHKKRR